MTRIKDYNAAVMRIRSGSITGLVFGLIAVWMGFQGDDWLSGAMAVGGAVVAADSVWVMRSPVSAGAGPLGAALIVAGLYFLARPEFSTGSMYAAFATIAGGLHVFADYRRLNTGDLAGALTTPPTPAQEAADRWDAEIEDLRSSTMASDPAHVQFKTAGLFGRFDWDGRLRLTDALFASTNRSHGDPMFAEREASVVVPKGDVTIKAGHRHLFFGSSRNASFHIGDRHMHGTIRPDALERYTRWKQSPP
jgi:hypothetical protein